MKRGILLVAILVTSMSFGQNTFPASGNVGIGTTNPKSKLEVTDWTTALTIGSTKNTEAMVDNEVLGAINFYKHYNIGYAAAIKLLQAGDGNQYSPAHLAFYTTSGGNVYTTAPEERMRITSSGNIGIGTTNPLNGINLFYLNDFQKGSIRFGHSGSSDGVMSFGWNEPTQNDAFKISIFPHNSISNQVDLLTILSNGNLGIGTMTPDTKLTVNGNIHAKEVKIDLSVPAPDYVFANDYKLKTLKEVEAYINKNSHLPEIPSAKEMEKNGVLLAEMNMNLLKKIEELTLYAIEQDKKINTKSNEIEVLKKDVEILKKDNELIKILAEKIVKMEAKIKAK